MAQSKVRMNETGPEAAPPVEATRSPRGRSREKEKPVPPPDCWIRAISFSASKIPSMLSSTGSTKQALSWPSGVPAFIRVGELGRKSRAASAARKASSQWPAVAWPSNGSSACATACATRRNSSSGISATWPAGSRRR